MTSPSKSTFSKAQQQPPQNLQQQQLMYHQRVVEERNPYKFIERTLTEARGQLEKMKDTPKLVETITDVRDWLIKGDDIECEEEEILEGREQVAQRSA